jgi:ABC-2 type transport system permease protein
MMPFRTGLLQVAAREARWIFSDRVALLLLFAVPLIAFSLLAATFSDAVVRNLRVDVVDQDRSQTSMRFVQAIDSAPGVAVAKRSSDLNGAMHAVRSGGAIAAVYIPRHLERDILDAKRPQIVIFFNKQYFTPGNIASSALQSAINATVAELPRRPSSKASFAPGSLVVEQYVLTNPALNYAQFLLRAILPTVLHVLIALGAGYAVGSEFGAARNFREWIELADGNPLTALIGKFAPYLAIYILMMAIGMAIIHGFYQLPFRGDPLIVAISACLLIVAYMSLSALFQLLTRNLAAGLSLTSVICSPAFGFAGVGFPVLAMGGFGQAWGALLPLRWYIHILFDQAARGTPLADAAYPFAMLGGLAISFFLLAWLRLGAIAGKPLKAPHVPSDQSMSAHLGISRAFKAEYARILSDRGIFGLLVMAPIIYGIFYPQPYVGQLIRNVPIAVVDDDGSELSRTIVQTLDADEAVSVAARPTTLAEAEAALARREVFGILNIPTGTEREVLKGNRARMPAYVDSAYFLLYNRTLQGILEAAGTVSADVAARGARPDGSLYHAALANKAPIEVLNQPLFNPTGGYGSYIVPAAFILILQQTLMMGAATVGGVAYERGGRVSRWRRGSPSAIAGQALAHLAIALPAFVLYLVVLPRVYGFSATDRLLDLLVVAVPFILSVSLLGQFLGSCFRQRESAMLLMIALSLPLFFLVGVAWPLEAIPDALRYTAALFPSTSGIDSLVRINQMGASFSDVFSDWRRLWTLVAIYGALAVVAARVLGTRESRQ